MYCTANANLKRGIQSMSMSMSISLPQSSIYNLAGGFTSTGVHQG
jgi:hypothetical protein